MRNRWNDSSKKALFCVACLIMAMTVLAEANESSSHGRETEEIHRESKLMITKTAVRLICASTDYKEDCSASLETEKSSDPRNLIRAAFDLAIAAIRSGIDKGMFDLKGKADADVHTREALNSCRELMDDAIDDLRRTRDKFRGFLFTRLSDFVEDLLVWLSGSITYQQTCIDGFEGIDSEAALIMERILMRGQRLTSNGLAIASNLDKLLKIFRIPFLKSRKGKLGILGSRGRSSDSSEPPSSEDSSQESSKDSSQDSSKDSPKDSESSNDSPKDTESSKDSPKDSSKGSQSTKESSKESTKETSKDSTKETSKDSTKESSKDSTKESSKDSTKESSKDSPKESSKDSPKESSKDSPKESSKDSPKESSKDSSQDPPQKDDSSKNRASDSSKDTPERADSSEKRNLSQEEEFPRWVKPHARRLLKARGRGIRADAVVAKDGSGKYRTIAQALANVPEKNKRKFVIHIKKGVYKEKVEVTKKMLNVMFVGDGPTNTIITGDVAFLPDRVGTFRTATVAVNGDNFMAKDIGFENTAGAARHQAVALRVSADFAVFYNCRMDGYQDTLYAHTHRQFYRNCRISGTIDFVFGDAKAVFQDCDFVIRRPMDNQQCIVTAQGRKDRRETTGIVIHNSRITGDATYLPVKSKNKAYLGRPWKEFSRTIIMNTEIDDVIDPEGWLKWNETFALNTLYYGEYRNSGRGSGQARRVRWKGIQRISSRDARQFTPGSFLRGNAWIPQTRVPYNAN